MRIRIVVADQSEARFYDTFGYLRPLRLAGTLRNPLARLHMRDIEADRPGRTLARSGSSGGRFRAGPSHAYDSERGAKRQALDAFARRIGADLARAQRAGRFERLALVAGPALLGSLRAALAPELLSRVALTLAKDVVHRRDWDVRAHLPREIFSASWTPGSGQIAV
jgi:protein required for attachment to host cells